MKKLGSGTGSHVGHISGSGSKYIVFRPTPLLHSAHLFVEIDELLVGQLEGLDGLEHGVPMTAGE